MALRASVPRGDGVMQDPSPAKGSIEIEKALYP
jgi:hypothetical protein